MARELVEEIVRLSTEFGILTEYTAFLAREGTDLAIVYTPMHGVGGPLALEALRRAGFSRVHPVPEQLEPDPSFPTVRFPNPEEPGAMDLAMALAAEKASACSAQVSLSFRAASKAMGRDGPRPRT